MAGSPSSHTFGPQSPYTMPSCTYSVPHERGTTGASLQSPDTTPSHTYGIPRERVTTGVSIRTTVTTELLNSIAQPLEAGGTQANPQQYAPAATNTQPGPLIKVFYIPSPSELVRIPPSRSHKLYVVTKGEDIGIYNDWYFLPILCIFLT